MLVSALSMMGFSSSETYKKIIQTFDIYGEIIRVLQRNYVMPLDPDILLDNAIMGMLYSLDPYTAFYPAEDEKDVELMTQGTYTGFGISVLEIDSLITITSITEGYSAQKAGLRAGDIIIQIDTTSMVGLNADSLSNYTGGEAGSTAFVKVVRGMDTLAKTVLRQKIDRPDVSCTTLLEPNIGYVKLEQFTTQSSKEFRAALKKLKQDASNLDGLILDLRQNPGGVLSAAVDICDLFVPEKTKIVTIKGMVESENRDFEAMLPAEEANMKLIVLVDEGSASASEVLAGAMQDLDRAVILGEKSYGKGLVQSFFDLPYQNMIKVTTAKYYTPSGRCIQKRNFAKEYHKAEEDTMNHIFYTKNGRSVKDADGIMPDTLVTRHEYDDIVKYVYRDQYIFKFAIEYCRKLKELPQDYKINDAVFDKFMNYLDSVDYQYETVEILLIKDLNEKTVEKKYSKETISKIETLKQEIINHNKKELQKNKADILHLIERDMFTYFYMEKDYYRENLMRDEQVAAACKLFHTPEYKKLLSK